MGQITVRVTQNGSPVVAAEVITVAPYGPFTTDASGEISISVPDGWGPHLMPIKVSGPNFELGMGATEVADGSTLEIEV